MPSNVTHMRAGSLAGHILSDVGTPQLIQASPALASSPTFP
jgi:hypothetical protein